MRIAPYARCAFFHRLRVATHRNEHRSFPIEPWNETCIASVHISEGAQHGSVEAEDGDQYVSRV
jgi:hypothetical protein